MGVRGFQRDLQRGKNGVQGVIRREKKREAILHKKGKAEIGVGSEKHKDRREIR